MKFNLFRTSVLSFPQKKDAELVKHAILGHAREQIEESFKVSYKRSGDVLTIEINTLEELARFRTIVGENLIIGKSWIEIYDDYRE